MRQIVVGILIFVLALGGAIFPAPPAVAAIAPCCIAHGHVPKPGVAPTCCCGSDGSCCEVAPSAPASPAPKDEKTPPPEQPTRLIPMPFAAAMPASAAAPRALAGTLVETPGLSTGHAGIRRHLELSILRD